jgi:hypothetical protein
MECSGTCSDVTTDPQNCGACGTACDAGDVCVDSTCQVPCDATMLSAAITDPWGVQWDGLDRTGLAYDAAKAACQAFGARLPTATEMFRVSATQSGAVGQPFNTSYLWTAVPIDKLDQATERLSDGATSTAAAATATGFRCVCPASIATGRSARSASRSAARTTTPKIALRCAAAPQSGSARTIAPTSPRRAR